MGKNNHIHDVSPSNSPAWSSRNSLVKAGCLESLVVVGFGRNAKGEINASTNAVYSELLKFTLLFKMWRILSV